MTGSGPQGYQGRCWNCRQRGEYAGGGQMTCRWCEVSWNSWPLDPRPDPDRVVFWMGTVVVGVDFTAPQALGSPA
jgi:hypothetical protein